MSIIYGGYLYFKIGTMYAVITSTGNAGGFIGSMLGAIIISALNITATSILFFYHRF